MSGRHLLFRGVDSFSRPRLLGVRAWHLLAVNDAGGLERDGADGLCIDAQQHVRGRDLSVCRLNADNRPRVLALHVGHVPARRHDPYQHHGWPGAHCVPLRLHLLHAGLLCLCARLGDLRPHVFAMWRQLFQQWHK